MGNVFGEHYERLICRVNVPCCSNNMCEILLTSVNTIAALMNVYSTKRIDVASSKRTCFAHYIGH